jgi:NCAIR mutase (PurE)-related protein
MSEHDDRPWARLDIDRTRRIDMPEAVYCQGKTVEQCIDVVARMLRDGTDAVIATRATPAQQDALAALAPDAHAGSTLSWRHRPATGARIALVAGGTSDIPVMDECRITLEALGHATQMVVDVGVAGLHRLLRALEEFADADVIVAFAGMEAALPTVLAGLVPAPIVAVPTSVGYGTAFQGVTGLLSMLTSCAPGIAVVGIDNGYGAACAAHRIARRR